MQRLGNQVWYKVYAGQSVTKGVKLWATKAAQQGLVKRLGGTVWYKGCHRSMGHKIS